ncbi:hypothetical protein LIER_17155 [Lithospermum erythrorhizon]|uniref:Uncharacterized protein n=1 Tax=Lithospermum erythrorhizon TaxID=34254 RepID=A0AAV3QEP5_LITER
MDMVDGAYNCIIGQPALSQFEVVVSFIHFTLKFPIQYETREMQKSQKKARVPPVSSAIGKAHGKGCLAALTGCLGVSSEQCPHLGGGKGAEASVLRQPRDDGGGDQVSLGGKTGLCLDYGG